MLPAANHIPQLLVLLSQLSDELVLTKRCSACYRALNWMERGRLVPCLQCLQQGTEYFEPRFSALSGLRVLVDARCVLDALGT